MMNKILVVAAHPDDEVLGCGATIAKYTKDGDKVQVVFLADGFSSRSNSSDRYNAAEKASNILGCESPIFLNFPDNRLDTVPLLEIIKKIENIISKFQPNIVYTHHFGDLNIDHVIAHKAVITACRPQPGFCVNRIFSFEIPSSTEWQLIGVSAVFQPNWYEDVTDTFSLKMKALGVYELEMREWPHSRSQESVQYLAKWRGSSVGREALEAFTVLRIIN
jgi:N-acetylglucosamine malate deacetylase 1